MSDILGPRASNKSLRTCQDIYFEYIWNRRLKFVFSLILKNLKAYVIYGSQAKNMNVFYYV